MSFFVVRLDSMSRLSRSRPPKPLRIASDESRLDPFSAFLRDFGGLPLCWLFGAGLKNQKPGNSYA